MSCFYVNFAESDNFGWRYGSDTIIYTERFAGGRLLCCGYQDNGVPVYTSDEYTDVPSFDLVIDGESLQHGWVFENFESKKEGHAAVGILTMVHSLKPVKLTVTTRAFGGGFFSRRIEITNISPEKSLSITTVKPLCGYLWRSKPEMNLKSPPFAHYSVGHFRDFNWGQEGNFGWQDIPLNTEIAYSSFSGRSGHSCPFFVLRNDVYGGYMACHLGWSANWKTAFRTEFAPRDQRQRLRFEVMPQAIPPMRVIAPGETVIAPDVHFGLSHDNFDDIIQRLHAYLRQNVLRKVGDGIQPVIYNHWSYMEHEMSEDKLKREIDIAAEVGAEMFVVDAGWFGDVGTSWFDTTGDWKAGSRLPNDLFPVFDYARKHGLGCGLWVEVESAGKESKLAAEHPDWFISRYGGSIERILDLTKPEVRDYVESTVMGLIERYKLDMFRLDYNLTQQEGGFNIVDGFNENTLWRHVEAIYDIFDKVRDRFPGIQLENCSSGGGRTDLGIVSRFTTTWVSDWMALPRTVRILNGMTMSLPPEYVSRMVGAGLSGDIGSMDTLMHVAVLGHLGLTGLTPSIEGANPDLMKLVKKYVNIYKEFIRPFHREALVYHHTLVISGYEGEGWCALEYVSPDRKRAVAGVFRLIEAIEDSYILRFRGLNPSLDYSIRIEPGGVAIEAGGYELMQDGIEFRLDSPLTSRLCLIAATH